MRSEHKALSRTEMTLFPNLENTKLKFKNFEGPQNLKQVIGWLRQKEPGEISIFHLLFSFHTNSDLEHLLLRCVVLSLCRYLLCVLLPLPLPLLHLAALLLLPLFLLSLAHCRKRHVVFISPPSQQLSQRYFCTERHALTFLLQLVVVQKQTDHLFGLQRVRFEVASGDDHPLDLKT